MDKTPLLEVRHLSQYFDSGGLVKAVDDVSFAIYEGEILGLTGKSGSGKSTLGKSILHLYQPTNGEIRFQGQMISTPAAYRKNRAQICRSIQMVFQDASGSMNPRMTVGEIVAEPLTLYFPRQSTTERGRQVGMLLEQTGLDAGIAARYPLELSGGQQQRVCIARALTLEPRLLIADEPVAALDVSMQAQIVNLLLQLQKERGLACLFISHDLAVVRHVSDRVGVMQQGKLISL